MEEVLVERALKTTIRILYDKGSSDKYDNTDEVLKDYLLIDGVNERRRREIWQLNEYVLIQ